MKIFTRKRWIFYFFILISSFSHAQTDVLTQHNDNNRTGWYSGETKLTPSNVTPTNFGLLYKRPVDDQIYAQPLLVNGVMIGGFPKNVVYVATVNNTIYAFDADDGSADPYWVKHFTPTNQIPPNAGDIHSISLCGFGGFDDIYKSPRATGQESSFGIIGTPVIDKASNTLYFVFRSRELTVDNTPQGQNNHFQDPDWSPAGFYQYFNAIDLSTGSNRPGLPVLIDPATTQVTGTGAGNVNGIISFNPRTENQRGGLTLSNGIVYIPYAGHCDMNNYYGWILGYQANNPTQQVIRYVTAPNSERGGTWMSGAGLAVDDATGNLYFAVGNGGVNSQANDAGNMSLGIVRAAPDLANHTLTNIAAFQPNQGTYKVWNDADLDFGTGVVLIPGSNMVVTAHKTSNIYVVNKNANSGKYDELDKTKFLGKYNIGAGGSHSSINYFGGNAGKWIYQFSEDTHVTAYPVDLAGSVLGTKITNTSIPTNNGLLGGFMSVSSNGTDDNSAILWVTHVTPGGGALHALKASNITQELWNSDVNPIDKLGDYAKMNCVTIANGYVYAPTFTNTLNVYGLLTNSNRCVNNIALNKIPLVSSENATNNGTKALDGDNNSYWAVGNTLQNSFFTVDLGGRFDICKIRINWNSISDYGKQFTIDISDDGTTWANLEPQTINNFGTGDALFNEFNENATARFVRVSIPQQGNLAMAELQVFGEAASNCVPPPVSSLVVSNITPNSAILGWGAVAGAVNYVVKYRSQTIQSYVTRIIPASTNPLTLNISALTCGYDYDFSVQTDCGAGILSAASVTTFTTADCTDPCPPVPTRYKHGDLGDIKTAGSSCYTKPTFSITGAGTGIGGTSDQFQYNYAPLSVDEDFIMRVASQDNILGAGANQAGIMMRDSATDISRFIYIGKTGNNQLQMIYRAQPGAMAVVTSMPNPTGANYFRIQKAGTKYNAFYGISATGPWSQMGTVQDLNFGTGQFTIGMAVSAAGTDPTTTSTATFDGMTEGSTPLPVQLLNFTASEVQHQYVSLQWQTAQEVNNDHFEVERSIDGNTFAKIDSVKAIGNSNTIQSYSSVDRNPAEGINFYRLLQVDIDGHFSYSPIRIVKFGTKVSPLVYPNPVSSVFTAVPGKEPIRDIVIYNSQGKAVQFVMGNTSDEEMKVNISSLATGVYILKIKTDSQIYQYKIIKN